MTSARGVDLKVELVIVPVSDVDRVKRSYSDRGSFASFSDPDGTGWLLQEVGRRG